MMLVRRLPKRQAAVKRHNRTAGQAGKEEMMKSRLFRKMGIALVLALLTTVMVQTFAEARAGGSRSMGSRGSRSYSRPMSPSPSPYQSQAPQRQMAPAPYQQPR